MLTRSVDMSLSWSPEVSHFARLMTIGINPRIKIDELLGVLVSGYLELLGQSLFAQKDGGKTYVALIADQEVPRHTIDYTRQCINVTLTPAGLLALEVLRHKLGQEWLRVSIELLISQLIIRTGVLAGTPENRLRQRFRWLTQLAKSVTSDTILGPNDLWPGMIIGGEYLVIGPPESFMTWRPDDHYGSPNVVLQDTGTVFSLTHQGMMITCATTFAQKKDDHDLGSYVNIGRELVLPAITIV
ncbi:hypothetical protein HGA91_03750 [candidate division WWE3 bacterium]|nr:hypothetical protein [candidate division WWE3 bacterium]